MISEGPKDGGGVASLVSNWSEVFTRLTFFFSSLVALLGKIANLLIVVYRVSQRRKIMRRVSLRCCVLLLQGVLCYNTVARTIVSQ